LKELEALFLCGLAEPGHGPLLGLSALLQTPQRCARLVKSLKRLAHTAPRSPFLGKLKRTLGTLSLLLRGARGFVRLAAEALEPFELAALLGKGRSRAGVLQATLALGFGCS
jgi:hypothetical protein